MKKKKKKKRRNYIKNECKNKVYIRAFELYKYKNIEKYFDTYTKVYVGRTSEEYFSLRTRKFINSIIKRTNKNKKLIELYDKFIEYYLNENNLKRTKKNIKKAEYELFYKCMKNSFVDAVSEDNAIILEKQKIQEFKQLSDNPFCSVTLLNEDIKDVETSYNADIFLMSEKQIKEEIKELKENKKLYIV